MATDEQTLIARARVLEAELNKTLAAIANEGVTIDYRAYGVRAGLGGVEGVRFEFDFSRITKVVL